jgi:hypothetical protein
MAESDRARQHRRRTFRTGRKRIVSTDINSFWQILLWSFWIFIWIGAIMIWFRCIMDLFSDSTLSGWGKAGWAIVLVFIPWVGTLIYLIARGRSMGRRQMDAIAEQQAAQEDYIKQVAAKSTTPSEQIATAQSLLNAGSIDQSEFDTLKAKALA